MMAFEGNSIHTFARNSFLEEPVSLTKIRPYCASVRKTELLWTFVLNQFIQTQSKFLIDLVTINYESIKI